MSLYGFSLIDGTVSLYLYDGCASSYLGDFGMCAWDLFCKENSDDYLIQSVICLDGQIRVYLIKV